MYIVIDGFFILGDGLFMSCKSFISSKKLILLDCCKILFVEIVKCVKKGVYYNVILLFIEGDFFVLFMYWEWICVISGIFLLFVLEWF